MRRLPRLVDISQVRLMPSTLLTLSVVTNVVDSARAILLATLPAQLTFGISHARQCPQH